MVCGVVAFATLHAGVSCASSAGGSPSENCAKIVALWARGVARVGGALFSFVWRKSRSWVCCGSCGGCASKMGAVWSSPCSSGLLGLASIACDFLRHFRSLFLGWSFRPNCPAWSCGLRFRSMAVEVSWFGEHFVSLGGTSLYIWCCIVGVPYVHLVTWECGHGYHAIRPTRLWRFGIEWRFRSRDSRTPNDNVFKHWMGNF